MSASQPGFCKSLRGIEDVGSGTHPELECQQCPRGRRWDGSDRTGGQREADVEGCLEGLCDLSFGAEEAEGGRSERGEPVGDLASFPAEWAW